MPLLIDQDFPGGNIIVDSIYGNEVCMRQRLDSEQPWFYWCCRIRGAEGRRIRFTMTSSSALGTRGPAISHDNGTSWQWLGREVVDGASFTVEFPENANCAHLSFAMPYLEKDWHRFIGEIDDHATFVQSTLCATPQGRKVECIELQFSDQPLNRIVITCRHHCCEMMCNYALEGLIKWLMNAPDAQWLREHAAFLIVPFIDKDGVESGDQGKLRLPRDHNRDYDADSIYATTRALKDKIPEWGIGKRQIGIDLHCPYIAGKGNEDIYLVGTNNKRIDKEQRTFSQLLQDTATGPLPVHASHYLPFGESWNTSENQSQGKSFANWMAELPETILSTTIELPYANVRHAEVNADSARLFGGDLGKTMARYLQRLP